jgi:hypothetical protein
MEEYKFEEKIEKKFIQGITSAFLFLFLLFFIIIPLLYNLNKSTIYKNDIIDLFKDC